jgi:integrase
MSDWRSPLADQLQRFLAHRRALGFAYIREERFLREVDRLATSSTDAVVSEAFARSYLSVFDPASRQHRLTILRQLARFLLLEEPRTFLPPPHFLGIRRRRPVVRVLSRDEARRFLDACDQISHGSSNPQSVVHGVALRTLLLTGLRRGEVLGLRDRDVDLTEGLLTISRAKFGKTRFVPLAPDLTHRLQTYRTRIAALISSPRPGDPFFPRADGRRPTAPKSLYKSFRRVLQIAGIEHRGRGQGPRLHDLRHSFAVLKLLSWYEASANLGAKLPLLATYLGHVGLATSQVYLHMTPDLATEVTRRQLQKFGDFITAEAP